MLKCSLHFHMLHATCYMLIFALPLRATLIHSTCSNPRCLHDHIPTCPHMTFDSSTGGVASTSENHENPNPVTGLYVSSPDFEALVKRWPRDPSKINAKIWMVRLDVHSASWSFLHYFNVKALHIHIDDALVCHMWLHTMFKCMFEIVWVWHLTVDAQRLPNDTFEWFELN